MLANYEEIQIFLQRIYNQTTLGITSRPHGMIKIKLIKETRCSCINEEFSDKLVHNTSVLTHSMAIDIFNHDST